MGNIFLERLELVIFDLDGTLYDQPKLRKIMLLKLISYYVFRPWKFKDLLILYHFRKEREKRSGIQEEHLQDKQYVWCAEKTNYSIGRIRAVVDKWIFNEPLADLKKCMYAGVDQFISDLKGAGIKTAIYSDYDTKKKMQVMQLEVDLEVCSTDEYLNSFKPQPNGLKMILSSLRVTAPKNVLFIGDRLDLDGECAKNAGVEFLLVNRSTAHSDFYLNLSKELLYSIHKIFVK